jgi:hypothetical protein
MWKIAETFFAPVDVNTEDHASIIILLMFRVEEA